MSKKEEPKDVHINLIVEKMAPDRNQYKPYGLSFLPHGVMVSIPIDSQEVTVTEDGIAVLTLDGLMELTGKIADSIDDLHNKHLEDLQKGLK